MTPPRLVSVFVAAAMSLLAGSASAQSSATQAPPVDPSPVMKRYAQAWMDSAEQARSQAELPRLKSIENPIGVGVLLGTAGGQPDRSVVVEGLNHFTQRPGPMGLTRYGQGQFRGEAGSSGVGLAFAAMVGFPVVSLRSGERVSPLLALEPVNSRFSLNSSDRRNDHYAWLPMISAGGQFAYGSCRLAPMIRGGGQVGTLGKPGGLPAMAPSYGAGAYLNCWQADLAAEWLRVAGRDRDADLALVDVSWRLTTSGLKLGARGERLDLSSRTSSTTENRAMLFVRGVIPLSF